MNFALNETEYEWRINCVYTDIYNYKTIFLIIAINVTAKSRKFSL